MIAKRALLAGAAMAVVVGLFGCASSDVGPASTGDAPESVLMGGLFAMSGPAAAYGDWFSKASSLAVKHINEAGGLNGKTKINFKIEDTQQRPDPAVQALQRLIGEDVRFVMSSSSIQTLALLPIANQREIPMINGGAQSDLLNDASPFLFNTIPLLNKESEVLAQYLHDESGFTKAAVIHTSDDGGVSAYENFKRSYEKAGGEIVAVEGAEYQGTDYRSQLTKLKSSGADVLMIGAYGLDANNIISQVREIGWDVPLANTSWVAIADVLANPAAEGLIHTVIPFNPSDEFIKQYTDEFGVAPDNGFIGNYYDGVMVFAEAYEKASNGGTVDPDGKAIADAIREIKTFDSVYGSELVFDESGSVSRPISIAEIRGGQTIVTHENYGS
ncbi:ABC transporter substrate-binding protein [Glaciibacter superstes]|uniref:ABC transporter substrate-binding protein n=1 Tax=Glaciibacter superstes TaxID=501023 RepID=UPI0003B6C3A0|nr:ABC transporter substrate-binding protein [Glaciibacter superstes]